MADIPPPLAQALADRYRLERELGQGGMATVYLAHDLKHDRRVAVKVLRPELAAVIGAERFVAEIKVTANLQHPHILPLHDSGVAGSFLFYVMPFVEGESLRDRLNREKQLPVGDAIRIASEVASALDYAHRHGVIHRDIKPENILLHEGQALVADFGIALAVSAAGGSRMTETGLSLGTPHYMSPEQAMGERTLDARTDIYALGCVTYEMLLGEPPFTGPTAQAIVAKVMTEKPAPLLSRRDTIPEAVEDAVLTALAKLPADRWGSAAEFGAALGGKAHGRTGGRERSDSRTSAPSNRRAVFLLAGLAAVLALTTAWLGVRSTRTAAAPVARYELRTPAMRPQGPNYTGNTFALSPDGSRLAYVGESPRGTGQLWIRDRDALVPHPLDGTDGADAPFFSPDGHWVGYFAGGTVYKVAVTGGAPVALADSTSRSATAGTWLADGSILFTSDIFALRRIPPEGGTPTVAANPPSSLAAVFPVMLPRPDAVLATICTNNCARMTIYALNLRTREWKKLVDGSRSWYLPSGHLLYARQDGTVLAARFDLDALELRGAAVPVLTGVQVANGIVPELDIAASGMLAYLPGEALQNDLAVVRVDRQGKATPVDPAWRANINSLALSPDGTRLAVSIVSGAGTTLWIKQLNRGPLTRLSFEGSLNYRPAWRPDGRTLSFTSDRAGPSWLFGVRSDGSSTQERVTPSDTAQMDESEWSEDGKWLIYRVGVTDGQRHIYARGTGSDSARVPIATGRFDEYMPALSPDSRWIAYVSIESGQEEVYVRPFPHAAEARWQVSTDGGGSPAWAHSGRELFYISRAGKLVSVAIPAGAEFHPGQQKELFPFTGLVRAPFHRSYAVSPDDRSFIMLQGDLATGAADVYLTVVLHWFDELKAKLGK